MQFYEHLAALESAGTPFAIATIVRASASSPGRTAFKMCMTADGQSVGSVGGGGLEFRVQNTIKEMFRTGETARLESYHLNETPEGIGMACGGDADVYIEIVAPKPKLVIFGGGHIGSALVRFASEVGFEVTVVDDRPAFAAADAHPAAVHTECIESYKAVADIELPQNAYFVIVTHQHIGDGTCLRGLLGRPALAPKYIGLIGSSKKLARVFGDMLKDGFDRTTLESVHAPIGIDLGGQSANEIALAIAAEIVAVRYGKTIHDAMCLKKHPLSVTVEP